jgi:hypothetical protein
MNRPHVMSGGRYPVLRSLAILYVIAGAVWGAAGACSALWILFAPRLGGLAPGIIDRVFLAIGALVVTFFGVITMLAVAEVLKLFIDVEHNTRMSASDQVVPTTVTMQTRGDGGRLTAIDEETAEGALRRGH